MLKIFAKDTNRKPLSKIVNKKQTLYDNLIYNGYKYSMTKAIDIALSVYKIPQEQLDNSIRIRSNLTFHSQYTPIYSVEGIKDGVIEIIINNSGFAGIEGTIPDPYVEHYVLYNRTSKQAVLDFFDIFNHAIFITRYLFDKKQVVECLSDRVENSLIGAIISSLAGFDPCLPKNRSVLPRQFQISAQNLFWRYTRSADMLKVMLFGFFEINVDIEQFVGGFSAEAPLNELSRIGTVEGIYNSLGKAFILGSKIWDSTLGIIIHIRSLSLDMYKSFLPKASEKDREYSKLAKIKEMIKLYVPNGINVKMIFYLKQKNISGSYLNGIGRLNKDLFIGGTSPHSSISFTEYIS